MDAFFALGVDPLQVIALYQNLLPSVLVPKYIFPLPIEELSMTFLSHHRKETFNRPL